MRLEPSLQRDVSTMSLRSLDNIDIVVPPQTKRVQDFFLLMTICNTVVVSPHSHQDHVGGFNSKLKNKFFIRFRKQGKEN